jgi:hypothetical protein
MLALLAAVVLFPVWVDEMRWNAEREKVNRGSGQVGPQLSII